MQKYSYTLFRALNLTRLYNVVHMTHRRFNNLLSLIIFLMAVYIFFLPFIPQVGWWVRHSAPIISTPVHTQLPPVTAPIPKTNQLIIPAMDLNQLIYQGQSVYTVNKGVWIRPNGSTPNKGSNTIMVGHRLTYTDPEGVFYFLNKLQIGDPIQVDWQGVAYNYKVTSISVVNPQDISIESPTPDSRLTLYTCTPLWSLKDRLVVVAERTN